MANNEKFITIDSLQIFKELQEKHLKIIQQSIDATNSSILVSNATAKTALATAKTARATADTARATADTAVSTAKTARATADTAVSTAKTAKATAETAVSTAETAVATADTATATAETAKATADTAKMTAETAVATSETAVSTADTAKATSEVAVSTAEVAKVTAETAKSTADTAVSTAAAAASAAAVAAYTEGIAESVYKCEKAISGCANAVDQCVDAEKSCVSATETCVKATEQIGTTITEQIKIQYGEDSDTYKKLVEIATGYEQAKEEINVAKQEVNGAKAEVTQAKSDINDAIGEGKTALNAIKDEADLAKAAAEKAKTDAESAVTDANAAVSSANSAKDAAEQAKTEALNAQGNAQLAAGNAATAQSKAEKAQGNAEKAQSNAEKAEGNAQQAVNNANAAVTSAQEAQSNAEKAVVNAQDAENNAKAAQTKAKEAEDAAVQAQTYAEEAQGAAEKAAAQAGELLKKFNDSYMEAVSQQACVHNILFQGKYYSNIGVVDLVTGQMIHIKNLLFSVYSDSSKSILTVEQLVDCLDDITNFTTKGSGGEFNPAWSQDYAFEGNAVIQACGTLYDIDYRRHSITKIILGDVYESEPNINIYFVNGNGSENNVKVKLSDLIENITDSVTFLGKSPFNKLKDVTYGNVEYSSKKSAEETSGDIRYIRFNNNASFTISGYNPNEYTFIIDFQIYMKCPSSIVENKQISQEWVEPETSYEEGYYVPVEKWVYNKLNHINNTYLGSIQVNPQENFEIKFTNKVIGEYNGSKEQAYKIAYRFINPNTHECISNWTTIKL